MGPKGFFPWIRGLGYEPKYVYISGDSRLLVDVKGLMYVLAYGIPSDVENFHEAVANAILEKLTHFACVLLVNDGKIDTNHPKFETSCKRKANTTKRQQVAKKRKLEEAPDSLFFQLKPSLAKQEQQDEEEHKSAFCGGMSPYERQMRSARGITYQDSVIICELVQKRQSGNISYLQIEFGEADQMLMQLSSQFDYTVSKDADLLVGGVENLLYGFCTAEQAVYSAKDICVHLGLTPCQLRDIVTLSGNDYGNGIRGMGLKKAYALVKKYKSGKQMLQNWTRKERGSFEVPEDIVEQLNVGEQMYNIPQACQEKLNECSLLKKPQKAEQQQDEYEVEQQQQDTV